MTWRPTAVLLLAGVLVTAAPASAQIDLTGSWTSRMYEDWFERGPGRDLGDFTGVPLNDEARAVGLSYEPTLLAMRERQCLPYSPLAWPYQPGGFRMWSEFDKDGNVVAWRTAAGTIRDMLVIWMDGRPRPSPNAFSSTTGFTTGKWEGHTLTTYTTNLKAHVLRRGNGLPASDRTTITAHFTRHENMLTITTIEEDPVYLTEPHVVTRTWELDPTGNVPPWTACNAVTEIPRLEGTGVVPHHLPGENPYETFMAKSYNVPQEAAMGYAETLYPEYRKKLRSTYRPPDRCERYCCGWVGFEGLPASAPGLRCIVGGGYSQQDKEILKSSEPR